MNFEEHISNLLYPIFINLISSFIFLFALLHFLRPKFKIVPFIAKTQSPFKDSNDPCFAFKVINKSYFGTFDVHAKVYSYKILQGENKIINKVISPIFLKTEKVNFVARNKFFNKNYGDNCIQFFTYEDLFYLLKNRNYIEFQITAKHSLTGLNSINTYEFVNPNLIRIGNFKSGNIEEII